MTDQKETFYCAECGSTDIHHDAIAKYNSEIEDYEIISVLDGYWCEACSTKTPGETGEPVFGVPGQKEAGDE